MSTWPGLLLPVLALPFAAYPQSTSLLDALRTQQPNTLQLAQQELETCQKNACPQLPQLQLLMGVLLLSETKSPQALEYLKEVVPPPSGLAHPPPPKTSPPQNLQPPGPYQGLTTVPSPGPPPNLPYPALSPPLLPFAYWYLSQAYAYAGEIPSALLYLQKIDQTAPPWLLSKALGRNAELLLLQKQYAASLKILDGLPSQNPEALFLLALNYLGMEEYEKAGGPLLQLAVRFPLHPHGGWAQEALTEPPLSQLLASHPSPTERLLRTQNLVEGGAFQYALEELARLPKKLPPPEKAEAAFWRARIYFAQGKPEWAQLQITRALKGPPPVAQQAAWLMARRSIRSGDNVLARQWLKRAASKGLSKLSEEARFMSAWLWLNESKWEEAQTALGEFAEKYPHSSFAVDARWFQGWAQFRQGNNPQASQTWLQAAVRYPKSPLLPQFLYWAARCTPQNTPAEEAAYLEALAQLTREFPGTLYGRMAKERLQNIQPLFPQLPLEPPPTALPQELGLALALTQTGLLADAQMEIEALKKQTRNPGAALRLGGALHYLGAYDVAYQLAARYLWGAAFLRKEITPLSLLFPPAFKAEVLNASLNYLLPPALVWAIMRRESAFSVSALSSANARGLMQMIPPTGKHIAQQLGVTLSNPDELFAPALNISFGAWYLQKLVERFGHLAPAIAAYNAGPKSVVKWLAARGQLPLDEWIEEIPFKETRLYVKQVLPDVYAFAEMYDGGGAPNLPPPPPWTWTLPEPQSEGVSF